MTSNINLRDHQEGLSPTPSISLHPQVLRKGQSEPKGQVPESSPNPIPKSADKEEDNKPPMSDQLVPVMEERCVSVLHVAEVLRPITPLPPTKVFRRISVLSPPKYPGITFEPHSSIDPGLAVEPHCSIDPGLAVELHSSIDPGLAVDSHSSIDPSLAVEPHSSIDPGLAVESHSSIDPSLAVEPHSSIDPVLAVEPHSSIDPGLAVESYSPIDPGLAVEPHASIDPGLAVEPHSSIDPGLAVESHSSIHPGLAVQSHSSIDAGLVVELDSSIDPGLAVESYPPIDPSLAVEPHSPVDPAFVDETSPVQLTLQRAMLKAPSLHHEQVQKALARARDLRRDRGRPSVPAALPGPIRVSSLKIQVHPNTEAWSTASPCFTFKEGQQRVEAITEEEQNFLPSMSRAVLKIPSIVRPHPLLYTPSYLSRNFTSLPRASSGQATQGLSKNTTCSLPSLLHRVPYSSPHINLHSAPFSPPDIKAHGAHYSSPHTNLHSVPYHPPDNKAYGAHCSSPHINLHSAPYSPPDNKAHGSHYSSPHINVHRAPYSTPDINVHGAHYSLPHTNLHSTPYSPPNINVDGAPYSLPHTNLHTTLSSAPYNTYYFVPCGTPYTAAQLSHLYLPWLYQSTPAPQPCPSALLSCTEEYLKHVLQNIQITVQSLTQVSLSLNDGQVHSLSMKFTFNGSNKHTVFVHEYVYISKPED